MASVNFEISLCYVCGSIYVGEHGCLSTKKHSQSEIKEIMLAGNPASQTTFDASNLMYCSLCDIAYEGEHECAELIKNPYNNKLPSGVVTLTFDNLEQADSYVKNLSDFEQALLYRALWLNGMRIDGAERLIERHRREQKENG